MAYSFSPGFQDATSHKMKELLHCHSHTNNYFPNQLSHTLHNFTSINDQPKLNKHNRYTRNGDNLRYSTVIILVIIALLSLQILYIIDEINNLSDC